MKKMALTWILSISAGLLLLVLTSVSKSPNSTGGMDAHQQAQVNLALREVADQILRQNEDLFSPIPPVQQERAGTYLIQLDSKVDYTQLRAIVDKVFERHQLRADYRLSLLDCQDGALLLGFLAYAADENKEVPCQGRAITSECYNLRLALVDQQGQVMANQVQVPVRQIHWWLMGLAVFFPLLWTAWQKKTEVAPAEVVEPNGWQVKTTHTAFHPVNQSLKINQATITLTFREAKLLNFFFENANLVLEREHIMQAVWEDEGIIVGRSLDVFVSRLRKKLKADPGLNIVNVHGVGYKMELSQN